MRFGRTWEKSSLDRWVTGSKLPIPYQDLLDKLTM